MLHLQRPVRRRVPPPKGVWGVAVSRVVGHETHCAHALLSPKLALPSALSVMLDCLLDDESITTPNLFRKPVSNAAIDAVRRFFDGSPRALVWTHLTHRRVRARTRTHLCATRVRT